MVSTIALVLTLVDVVFDFNCPYMLTLLPCKHELAPHNFILRTRALEQSSQAEATGGSDKPTCNGQSECSAAGC